MKSKKFKHYIMTRYNLGLYQANPYKVKYKVEWMASRIPLFKAYLKSLEEQTYKHFTVILSVDGFTPVENLKEIQDLIDATNLDVVIHLDEQPDTYVRRFGHVEKWLITSRLDSDDTYEPEFVETIQRSFQFVEECLDVEGYKFDGKDYFKYKGTRVGSPFVSVIERSKGQIKTANFKQHSQMSRHFFSRFVGKKPLFTQVIHGANIINSIRGEEKTTRQ